MSEKAKRLSDIANFGEQSWVNGTAQYRSTEINHYRLSITDADVGPGFTFLRRSSMNSLMLICYSGCAKVHVAGNDEPFDLHPGDATYVPQGQRIAYQGIDGSRFGHFGLEWYDPALAPASTKPLKQPLQADPDTLRLLHEGICREIAAEHFDQVLAAMYAACHQIGVRAIQGETKSSPLMQLRLELGRHLARPWSNSEMAGVLQTSESSLRRLCRQELNQSPMQMLTEMRLKRAAELLKTTSATIQDIAQQVGYESPFAFTKAFRRLFEQTPSQYRG